MIRRLVVLVVAMLGLTLVTGVPAASASAASTSRYGITVRMPRAATSYNGGRVSIRASITVARGVHRSVIDRSVIAYRYRHRVASGRSIRLGVGSYSIATRVKFRNFGYVTRSRTVRTWHEGGMPDGSSCTVTAVADWDGDGVGDAISAADCTNPAYPGQVVHDTDTVTNDVATSYEVGETVSSDYVEFAGYYSTALQRYTVRTWVGGYHYWTTPRQRLTVRNGGHLRKWSGNDTYTTGWNRVSKGAKVLYAFRTNYDGTCYFGLNAEYGDGTVQELVDLYRYSGSGAFRTTKAVRVRFVIYSACDWALQLRWK